MLLDLGRAGGRSRLGVFRFWREIVSVGRRFLRRRTLFCKMDLGLLTWNVCVETQNFGSKKKVRRQARCNIMP